MPESAPIKAELAAHCYTGISGYTHSSIIQEMTNVRSRIAWMERIPARDALLSRVRNTLLSEGLDGGADVQVWLDHDIQFQPGALSGLVLRCIETKGIVGGLYPYRSKGSLGFPVRWKHGVGQVHLAIAVPESIQEPVRPDAGELIECEAAGGGFVAFYLPALREGLPRLLDHADPHMRVTRYTRGRQGGHAWDLCRPFTLTRADGVSEYVSEDWAACLRMGAVGMRSYAWTGPYLIHYGELGFTPEEAMGRGVNVPEALRAWEKGRAMEGKP